MNALTKSNETRDFVDLLWNYRLVLRDDLSSIDYIEQLTLLLVLKMAQEHADRNDGRDATAPADLGWLTLLDADPEECNERYEMIVEELGRKRDSAVGLVFHGVQNKIRNTTSFKRLISDVIDKVNWSAMGVDIMGDVYEALLLKGVDGKHGDGQYYTPRALVDMMVNCVQPEPDDTIVDPTSGTGGYLVAAHRYIAKNCDSNRIPEYLRRLRDGGIRGVELVPSVARLAQMNLLLHGMGSLNGRALIEVGDALTRPAEKVSLVLANPPFGRKYRHNSMDEVSRLVREDVGCDRTDTWVKTANQQFNFVQHIANMLTIDGRAAVIVPDNVLFEGGAGEHIRRWLLRDFDVHTLLRLPAGIFYATGVRANVLFFDRKQVRAEGNWTSRLWVYDLRADQPVLPRRNLQDHHLDDFVKSYKPGADRDQRTETERFRSFTLDELLARDEVNLDITWSRDHALDRGDGSQPPEEIAEEIADELRAALSELQDVAEALQRIKSERENRAANP